jgi:hypothetical protein
VKWLDLLRFQTSADLVEDSKAGGANIQMVTVDKSSIGVWVDAKKRNLAVHLRKPDIAKDGQQLPIKHDDAHYLGGLVIGNIDEAHGTIMLSGPSPFPTFPKGSFLFIPRREKTGELAYVVEKKVLEKLNTLSMPLNQNTDTTQLNNDADFPIEIAGFKPPCLTYKLVGVYEGGGTYTGMIYRSAGLCKMRNFNPELGDAGDRSFCHVCKYLIVMRVAPGLLALLDEKYYPIAKKNG